MRQMRRWAWLGWMGVVGLTGCGESRTYEVAPYKVPCHGVGPMLCMQVKEPGADTQQLFYDGISGFSFQWGVTQTLDVRVLDVENPPADGSSLQYVLERVVEQTRVPEGSRFQLKLTGSFIWPDQGQGLSLASERFICATAELCNELARMAGDETQAVTVEFSYPSSSDKPLVAERLVPTP